MKLIATLATLAALVCQTEATDSSGVVEVVSVKVGNAPCTDEVVLKAASSLAVANAGTLSFSSTKLSTEKSASTDLQVLSATATLCAGATGEAILTTVAAAKANGVTTWTWTAAAACATGDLTVTLKNVCNNGVTDYSGANIGLKYKAAANDVKNSIQAVAGTTAAVGTPVTDNPTKIASFAVTKMPVGKSETGEFTATFTGDANLNGKKLVLNLPEGYTIPAGAKCSIKKKADTTAKIISAASDGGLATACTNTCYFSTVPIPASAGVGFLDTTEATFSCDKVTSGATVPAPAAGDVALKANSATNTNLFAGYAESKSASPTKSPTKAADSPASVATASGVVVGALGVAALFLA